MPIKQTVRIDPGWTLPGVWTALAHQTRHWLQEQQVNPRDAVVLLPFAALLPPLRMAFAQAGGWQVRVETTLTLAASLAPPTQTTPTACCGDGVLDRLNAALLLRSQRTAAALAQTDEATFEHMVSAVVDAAQAFMARAAAVVPAERSAFWALARTAVAQAQGGVAAAALESRLLAVALEWAVMSCEAAAPHSDHLLSMPASAWVVVRVGGPDAVADAVAQASASPALWLNLDPGDAWDEVKAAWAAGPDVEAPAEAHATDPATNQAPIQHAAIAHPKCWLCDDFEAEAQAVAALALQAINAGHVPVALVAVDRALVRRVRALLDRQQVPVLDETGWLLATTAAGARLMALLQAAQALHRAHAAPGMPLDDCPSACRDAVLDGLKSARLQAASEINGADQNAGLDALEALWRQRRRRGDRDAAARCWQQLLTQLAPLLQAPAAPLRQWLALTQQVLRAEGSLKLLEADAAGRQVMAALRLQGSDAPAWDAAAGATRFNLAAFVAWVAATLEQSPYLPVPDEQALVVMTPLARAFGRSFGAVLVPGADHRQLACPSVQAGLISPALARLLGMPDTRQKHQQQRLALVHLMRGAAVTFTRRMRDAGEPLSESPDLAWLLQTQGAAGDGVHSRLPAGPTWQPWAAGTQAVATFGVAKPLPSAPLDLPQRLSASQLEAYRQCPYRFFARAVLRLDEPDELDTALAKRDYGNWLHEVLHRFHSERDYAQPPAPQLQAAAAWATRKLAMDDGELMPWRASFEHFSPPYLAWLAERETAGWYWADGETDHERKGDELAGTHLRGRLDRLDHGPQGQRQVIDYKTGDATALVNKVKQPLEDTQLAFYAALLAAPADAAEGAAAASDHGDLLACYLSLDDPKAPRLIEHPHVANTAADMLLNLSAEWRRLRAGEALQALGEGAVCDTCEARGLCRRDHWQRATP